MNGYRDKGRTNSIMENDPIPNNQTGIENKPFIDPHDRRPKENNAIPIRYCISFFSLFTIIFTVIIVTFRGSNGSHTNFTNTTGINLTDVIDTSTFEYT